MRRPWKTSSVYWFRQRSRVARRTCWATTGAKAAAAASTLFLQQRAHVLVQRRRFSASNGRRDAIMLAWIRDTFYYAETRAQYAYCTRYINTHRVVRKHRNTFLFWDSTRVYTSTYTGGGGARGGCKLFNPREIFPKVVLSIANYVNHILYT